MKKVIFLGAVLFLVSQVCFAQIPQSMSYQGVLNNADGTTIADGEYTLIFKMYDVLTGGSALWTEEQSITTSNGVFNAILGNVNPITIPFDKQYYLGITVGTEELTPRIQLTASPYSLNARSIIGTSNVFKSSGAVGIRTLNPRHSLEVADTIYSSLGGFKFPDGTVQSTAAAGEGGSSLWTPSGEDIYRETGKVGIGTTEPSAKLDVEVSSGPAPGPTASIGSSDNSATGRYAIAMGDSAIASGDFSTAMGAHTIASGYFSTAMGFHTTADGDRATALGSYTNASGWASIASGEGTYANGYGATALGKNTFAFGFASTAIGQDIVATGDYTFGIGLGVLEERQITQSNTMAIMGGKVGIGTTSPSEALEVDGTVKVTSVSYSSPRTHYYMVGGESFVPERNVDYKNGSGSGGACILSGSGGLAAPVHLPHGATITSITAFFMDNSTSDIDVNLYAQVMSGYYAPLAEFDSSGITGYGDKTDNTININNSTVDNRNRAYLVRAYSDSWDQYNMRIMGASITYTIDEAP
ncbi:hypothetical protein ACFL6P_06955 [Candidatus Latescibacterota bacterium]